MQFSEQWLREWVNPPLTTRELSERLTMGGLEVDALTPVAASVSGVVVGEIVEANPHPNADRLRVCIVNAGDKESLSIVCGAANARAGIRIPVARVGAQLPNGLEIKRAKLRGVDSFGMLCSARELGIEDSFDGLWELPADAPIGVSLDAYLQLQDISITLGLTPNRGDCLSVAGVAREVAALSGTALRTESVLPSKITSQVQDTFPIRLDASDACPRYAGRVIRHINPRAQTPIWLRERLRRSGIRSIHPVVDVTNYVLLELGQPMHAFDLSQLRGGISVRFARDDEQITFLDHKTVNLRRGALLIADNEGPIALAGVMGGLRTAVTPDSVDLFLEAAFFAPDALAGQARSYGLHTDSSHRFERGVDPALPARAIERATELLQSIVGGAPGPTVVVEHVESLPRRATLNLRSSRVTHMLGQEYSNDKIERVLLDLGMHIEKTETGWRVTPPTFRFDIALEVDLIEEIARVSGYDAIRDQLAPAFVQVVGCSETTVSASSARNRLIERGYQEAITYSFVSEALQAKLVPDIAGRRLANPITADMAVMRTTLWTGLLGALAHNQNRQQPRVRLFEMGRVFVAGSESTRIAAVICGPALAANWSHGTQIVDFFDVKGDVESLLDLAGIGAEVRFIAASHTALQDGQCAKIETISGRHVGWLGAFHPTLHEHFNVRGTVYLFELEWAALALSKLPKFSELSKFPSIERDLAVVLDREIPSDQIRECAREAAGALLRELTIFDVYQGERIDSGRKSLALRFTLQDTVRTLTDEEADQLISRVLAALQKQFGAKLRD